MMLSLKVILSFLLSIAMQIGMISLLPASSGYTKPLPTLCCIFLINISIWLLARIVASGVQLSILIPLSATLTPLAAIGIGIFVYGEPAPVLKMILLLSAAGLIGWSSTI